LRSCTCGTWRSVCGACGADPMTSSVGRDHTRRQRPSRRSCTTLPPGTVHVWWRPTRENGVQPRGCPKGARWCTPAAAAAAATGQPARAACHARRTPTRSPDDKRRTRAVGLNHFETHPHLQLQDDTTSSFTFYLSLASLPPQPQSWRPLPSSRRHAAASALPSAAPSPPLSASSPPARSPTRRARPRATKCT